MFISSTYPISSHVSFRTPPIPLLEVMLFILLVAKPPVSSTYGRMTVSTGDMLLAPTLHITTIPVDNQELESNLGRWLRNKRNGKEEV